MTASTSELQLPRILAVGAQPEALEQLIDELRHCGLSTTSASPDALAEDMTDGVDLIAIDDSIDSIVRKQWEAQWRQRAPSIRIIRTHAPYAASQVVAAAQSDAAGAVDLPSYIARIGYDGPLKPTMETLSGLLECHIAAIPFEAIDVVLGRGIDLTPRTVDAKLIGAKRGGYCYEQNGLFKRVLSAIGFDVEAMVASVRWMAAPGVPPNPLTHMALRVYVEEEPWLVDVGFGGNMPPAPLRMETTAAQPTRLETYRIIPNGLRLLLQVRINDQWMSLYNLAPEPVLDNHFEMPNWYTSTHPSSHFRRELNVARTTPQARYALLGNRFTLRSQGRMERYFLDSIEVIDVLEDVFGLKPEPGWERLADNFLPDSSEQAP